MEWRFHRWSETAAVPSFLRRYDTEFYRVWMQRAGHFTRRLHERYPWLPDLCERCQRRLPALLPLATIIHGEYHAEQHPRDNGRNVPTDWESAALAAGEIDLASPLGAGTTNWPGFANSSIVSPVGPTARLPITACG